VADGAPRSAAQPEAQRRGGRIAAGYDSVTAAPSRLVDEHANGSEDQGVRHPLEQRPSGVTAAPAPAPSCSSETLVDPAS